MHLSTFFAFALLVVGATAQTIPVTVTDQSQSWGKRDNCPLGERSICARNVLSHRDLCWFLVSSARTAAVRYITTYILISYMTLTVNIFLQVVRMNSHASQRLGNACLFWIPERHHSYGEVLGFLKFIHAIKSFPMISILLPCSLYSDFTIFHSGLFSFYNQISYFRD